jgi:hypothetical protein
MEDSAWLLGEGATTMLFPTPLGFLLSLVYKTKFLLIPARVCDQVIRTL